MESFALPIEAMRARRGIKWRRYGDEVLPASIADMDFAVAEPVQRAIRSLVDQHDYGYAHREGHDRVESAFADRMRTRFGWDAGHERTVLISDVLQGIAAAILAFSEPGDGVVVQTPIYPPFLSGIDGTGRRRVLNPLVDSRVRLVVDAEGLRGVVDDRTRILLLCNPHNPSGRAFEREELAAIGSIAVERDLVIVSDEIHCDLVYPGGRHIPTGSLGQEIAARTITLNSATKGFNIAGLRCGVLHFGAPALKERFVQRIPPKLLGTPGITGIDATIAAWDHAQPWADKVVALLQQNRDWLAEAVAREFPGAVMRLPEATYLAWIDFSRLGLPQPAGTFFLEKARVGLSPGDNFGEQYGAFVRLNFATSPAILKEIVARMAAAVRSNASRS